MRNSISYDNVGNGVTSNSGPNPRLESVTTVFNGLVREEREGAGVSLYTNNAPVTDFRASGVLSYANSDRDRLEFIEQDGELLDDPTNYFNGRSSSAARADAAVHADAERPTEVSEDWFVSTDHEALRPEIAEDGSIEINGRFELTDAAPSDTGARMSANPNPTELEVFPTVTPGHEGDGDDSPGGGAVDDGSSDGDPADDGWSAGGSTGDEASGGSPAGEGAKSSAGAEDDAGSGSGAAGRATEQVDGLAVTGTEAAPIALMVLALLLSGAVLVRCSKGALTRPE